MGRILRSKRLLFVSNQGTSRGFQNKYLFWNMNTSRYMAQGTVDEFMTTVSKNGKTQGVVFIEKGSADAILKARK